MRFILINRFYWPDEPATAQLLTDLAEALAADGHGVNVIARRPGDTWPITDSRSGVTILRVRATRWSGRGALGKIADFATFYVGALFGVIVTARPGDIVVALTDPPLLGVGIWLTARLRRARVVHWVQDIYPEIAITVARQRWLNVVVPLRNLAWRRADTCVTLGTDMAGVLRTAGVATGKIARFPNWAPAGLAAQPSAAAESLRSEWHLAGKFVVLYSGNLGRVHDLDPLLDLAEQLLPFPDIAIVMVGSGARHAVLTQEAARRRLTNLHFHPSQPRTRLAQTLALGDLHLVTLLPGCEPYVFPSKLYGIAAIGRPVLFIGPRACELARLVRLNAMGLTFTRDAIPAMAAAISTLSGNPAERSRLAAAALRFTADSGDAAAAGKRWAALAARIAAGYRNGTDP